jgi:hypothetical protein
VPSRLRSRRGLAKHGYQSPILPPVKRLVFCLLQTVSCGRVPTSGRPRRKLFGFRSCLLSLIKAEFRTGTEQARREDTLHRGPFWNLVTAEKGTGVSVPVSPWGEDVIETSRSLHTSARQAGRREENIAGVRSG